MNLKFKLPTMDLELKLKTNANYLNFLGLFKMKKDK